MESQCTPLYAILIFELYKMLHLRKNSNSIKHRGKGKWEIILDARAKNFSLLPPPKMDAKSAVPGIPRSHGPRSGGRVSPTQVEAGHGVQMGSLLGPALPDSSPEGARRREGLGPAPGQHRSRPAHLWRAMPRSAP